MPQPVVADSFEQPQTKPVTVKTPPAPKIPLKPQPLSRPTGPDWLEQGFGQRRLGDDAAKKAKEQAEEKQRKEQLERLEALDKKRSRKMYQEIQTEIRKFQKDREQEKRGGTAKYVTGATGYSPEKQPKRETWKEKVKKTILPWTSKQGMGTGEITRGVSG